MKMLQFSCWNSFSSAAISFETSRLLYELEMLDFFFCLFMNILILIHCDKFFLSFRWVCKASSQLLYTFCSWFLLIIFNSHMFFFVFFARNGMFSLWYNFRFRQTELQTETAATDGIGMKKAWFRDTVRFTFSILLIFRLMTS